jgi:predicted lipoprotein with Yx(FWY)xxD motif
MFARNNVKALAIVLLITIVGLAACTPAATPAPVAAPTNPPAPTAIPPTAAPAPTNPPAATEAPTAAAPMAQAVTLQVAGNDTLGKFLADGAGNTLYLFTKDTKGTSNCYDKCATAWPPVIPEGQPTLKDGVDAAVISTTVRKDGSAQLTYNGWPLYYYFKDKAPGDITGQAVGNVWWVVSGEGNPIKPATVALTPTEKLGKILVDETGMALYLFTKDTPGVTNCYGKCEVAWPPLLTTGQPTLGEGVSTTAISTTMRKDGSMQVTYNGWPLYYYFKDKAAGDVTGQAVGKVWWVVSGEGNAIKPASLAITSTEKLGKILADGDGRTLYMFTKDSKDTTTCYDKCEVAWPPLLQTDKPAVGEGVDAAMLGTTTRKDGTIQVTYNGMPLYYYFKDQAPGDTTGQGVGSVWYVVGPDGKRIDKD